MTIPSFWKTESGIEFNYSKEFAIDITWFSPYKLEKCDWMGQKINNNPYISCKRTTLHVSKDFATWIEVNYYLREMVAETTNPE